MLLKFFLTLTLFSAIVVAENYENYKIYDIKTSNALQKSIVLRLAENNNYDFFFLPRSNEAPARVMIPPTEQKEFEEILTNFHITFELINENVFESIQLERIQNNLMRSVPSNGRVSFSSFLRFSEINAYLDELAQDYPSRVAVESVGKSYEGRDIKTIRISNGDGVANKNVIFVDAGIHAREWIAPAAAVYVIYQLVENYANNAKLLKDYDWIILPVVNPDGYEYTHTTSRMWRKTRKPVSTSCYGTDANRNFDFHWGEVGASSYSCADTFKGQSAFSEPETQILRNLLLNLKGRAKFYLTLHSYGNYLLYPWGYTSSLPDTWKDIDEIAQAGAAAIKASTGTKYTVGSSTNVLYAAAGGSDDYAFAKAEIPVSITMELPAGGTGFDPKPAQISTFVSETWTGIKAMAAAVIAKY